MANYLVAGRFAANGFGLAGGALIASSSGTEKWPDLYYSFISMNMKNDTADVFQKGFGYADGVLQKYFAPTVGQDVFFHLLCLSRPKSVGEVKLRSNNPRQRLYIDPKYLDDKRDVDTVMEGVKLALKMSKTEALKKIGAQLTPDLFPGCESHGNANDDNDAYWECFIRHITQTMWWVFFFKFTLSLALSKNVKPSPLNEVSCNLNSFLFFNSGITRPPSKWDFHWMKKLSLILL